jgi:hypothetical protein
LSGDETNIDGRQKQESYRARDYWSKEKDSSLLICQFYGDDEWYYGTARDALASTRNTSRPALA